MYSKSFVFNQIKGIADDLSIIRRLNELLVEKKEILIHIEEMISSQETMNEDWRGAEIFFALKIVDGDIQKLSDLENVAFRHLESVWLLNVKKLKAYFIWKIDDQGSEVHNFYKACDDIRDKLLTIDRTDLKNFVHVEQYIRDYYLNAKGQLDTKSEYVKDQIGIKAHLIYEITKHENKENNWYVAEFYTKMFYENIISAVTKLDEVSTIKILKALQLGKSRDNCYPVITAFEAAIAIQFLDKTLLRNLLDQSTLWDYSLAPVSYWFPSEAIRKAAGKSLTFDEKEGHLLYEGPMPENVRDRLKELVQSDEERKAINTLYFSSHIFPEKNMIL